MNAWLHRYRRGERLEEFSIFDWRFSIRKGSMNAWLHRYRRGERLGEFSIFDWRFSIRKRSMNAWLHRYRRGERLLVVLLPFSFYLLPSCFVFRSRGSPPFLQMCFDLGAPGRARVFVEIGLQQIERLWIGLPQEDLQSGSTRNRIAGFEGNY